MKSMDFVEALGQVDPEIVQEAMDIMINENAGARRKSSRILRIALIAAAAVALLAGSVYAATLSRMNLNKVDGATGTWAGQQVNFTDAELTLTFDVEGECHEVGFKAGYLPAGGNMSGQTVLGGNIEEDPDYVTYLGDWGADGLKPVPIIIECMNGEQMRGMTFAIFGHPEIVKQDEWNGWQRTELHLDMRHTVPEGATAMLDQYDLLLYSPERNCLIRIGSGEFGFDELEKVAEGLDVKVFDAIVGDMSEFGYGGDGNICYFNIGRG